jgi:hypothetical protein
MATSASVLLNSGMGVQLLETDEAAAKIGLDAMVRAEHRDRRGMAYSRSYPILTKEACRSYSYVQLPGASSMVPIASCKNSSM